MRWRLCSIGKTDILIHPSLLACFVYAGLTGYIWISVISVVSIAVHEAAHAGVSAMLGQAPRCMEFTPLGAVLRLEDECTLPLVRRMFVLLAGPAASLLLCWLALVCTSNRLIDVVTGRFVFVANAAILTINLLPVLPLDGGRLLVLLLGVILPKHAVLRIVKWVGTLVGIVLIGLNLFCCWKLGGWNLSLALTGCCVIYCAAASSTTWAMTELRYFLDRKIRLEKHSIMRTSVQTCLHTTPLIHLIRKLPPRSYGLFICMEAGSLRYLGYMDESHLIQHYLETPHDMVIDCMNHCPDRGERG